MSGERLLKHSDRVAGLQGDGNSGGQHLSAGPVQYRDQVDESPGHGNIGRVKGPHLVGPVDGHAPKQVRIDPVPRVLRAGPGFSVYRGDTHPLHQGADMPPPCLDAHAIKLIAEHACPHERFLKVQFIEAPHQFQITFGNGLGAVIQAAAADADQFGLPFQW